MKRETIQSNDVRVPTPQVGVATHVTRYNEDKVVFLHPVDFQRLSEVESLLEEISRSEIPAPSQAAIDAHRELETPGKPARDAATINRFFGS